MSVKELTPIEKEHYDYAIKMGLEHQNAMDFVAYSKLTQSEKDERRKRLRDRIRRFK